MHSTWALWTRWPQEYKDKFFWNQAGWVKFSSLTLDKLLCGYPGSQVVSPSRYLKIRPLPKKLVGERLASLMKYIDTLSH